MGCNFCSTSAMFGGKGKFIEFYETGQELFDIMCQLEANLRRQSFLRHGRELPGGQEACPRVAGPDAGARQAVVALCLQFGECAAEIHDRTIGGVGGLVGMDGPGRERLAVQEAGRDGHAFARSRTAVAWHSRARFEHHRTGGAYAGEHRRGDRACGQPQHRVSSVHALHADPRHAIVCGA